MPLASAIKKAPPLIWLETFAIEFLEESICLFYAQNAVFCDVEVILGKIHSMLSNFDSDFVLSLLFEVNLAFKLEFSSKGQQMAGKVRAAYLRISILKLWARNACVHLFKGAQLIIDYVSRPKLVPEGIPKQYT